MKKKLTGNANKVGEGGEAGTFGALLINFEMMAGGVLPFVLNLIEGQERRKKEGYSPTPANGDTVTT